MNFENRRGRPRHDDATTLGCVSSLSGIHIVDTAATPLDMCVDKRNSHGRFNYPATFVGTVDDPDDYIPDGLGVLRALRDALLEVVEGNRTTRSFVAMSGSLIVMNLKPKSERFRGHSSTEKRFEQRCLRFSISSFSSQSAICSLMCVLYSMMIWGIYTSCLGVVVGR